MLLHSLCSYVRTLFRKEFVRCKTSFLTRPCSCLHNYNSFVTPHTCEYRRTCLSWTAHDTAAAKKLCDDFFLMYNLKISNREWTLVIFRNNCVLSIMYYDVAKHFIIHLKLREYNRIDCRSNRNFLRIARIPLR